MPYPYSRRSALLLLARPLVSGEAAAVLQRVAGVYQSLIDYQLSAAVRITVKQGSQTLSEHLQIELAASLPRQLRLHQRSSTGFELLLATDGTTLSGYEPRRRLYLQRGADESSAERAALRQSHQRYAGRFTLLDRLNTTATLRGTKRHQGQQCTILHVAAIDQDWTEELWISPQTHLVLRSSFGEKLSTIPPQQQITRVDWHYTSLNRPLPAALFTLSPPANARRANVLPLP